MKSKRNYKSNNNSNNGNNTNIGATVKERIEYFEKHTNLALNRNIVSGSCPSDIVNSPVAQWHQFAKGRLIGSGSYCQVYASTATSTNCAVSSSSSSCPQQQRQQQQKRRRRRMAVKCLSNSLERHSKRYLMASFDLCMEAKLLERLNHENIIRLHAVKAGNVEDAVNNREYFIVLDRLTETLQDRMIQWKQSNNKRCLWGGGAFGNRPKREELGRVRTVAIGIANGMEYLHAKGIIFRYVLF
jgi:serine/threonine protein kinase